jgi:glycosyltransferase involved in cell wall biosynthesis
MNGMNRASWPSVSVVIPSFRQGKFIERTLLSIFNQRYGGDLQVIVSDGGSDDGTIDVLRKYGDRITWWSAKDNGIADAINKGLAASNGEILAIQSSDDWYLRDAFRLTIQQMQAQPEVAIVSGCDVYVQPDGVSFSCSQLDDHAVTAKSLLMKRILPQHCTFFRRAVYDKVGPLRDLREGAEIDFWYRALHYFNGQFIPWHTAAYQIHPQQRTKTGSTWYANMTQMVESCQADPTLGGLFRLTESEKKNLFIRWEIAQERLNGNELRACELIERVLNDSTYTDETLQHLQLHGFIPKSARQPAAKHPNYRVPDLMWAQAA